MNWRGDILKFTKMHGAGNDYVYLNCMESDVANKPELARRLSDRHRGVGGDGLICIAPSSTADFSMEMYNADGSRAEMCGNGIRCVGKYVYDRGLTDKTEINIETLAGIKTLWLNVDEKDGSVNSVRVDMGSPEFRPEMIPMRSDRGDFINQAIMVDDRWYEITALSVGNPHAVIFVSDVSTAPVAEIGPKIENHPLFPERVNVEFVEVTSHENLKMRVWERGSGETQACGTGATASLVAAALNGHTGDSARVSLTGGKLFIEWDRNANRLYMTGPAVTVFDGELTDFQGNAVQRTP